MKKNEITLEEAAAILEVPISIVRHRIDTGRLRSREAGSDRVMLLADVLKLREFERRRRKFAQDLSADTDDLETP